MNSIPFFKVVVCGWGVGGGGGLLCVGGVGGGGKHLCSLTVNTRITSNSISHFSTKHHQQQKRLLSL